jgi:eukaryotic-like serine/threonine-protein kinase
VTEHPSKIDRFEILKLIGQGGMAFVYLAHDPDLGRKIAIKLLKEEFDEHLRERFTREAYVVGGLDHQNLVTIYDIGDYQGRPYMAMRYIKGQTLAEQLRLAVPLTLVTKLRIIEELCAGLQAAHEAGIIHRDVKPANVMVDADGVVKILDFGIARLMQADTHHTQVGTVIGSYNYMSPEQMAGHAVDDRSDIFSVGAVFYELLCGERAFPGTMQEGLWNRLVREPPPLLRDRCADLDDEVERIVTRALEKEPDNRYENIATLRLEIALARDRIETAEVSRLLAQAQEALDRRDDDAATAAMNDARAIRPRDARVVGLAKHVLALRSEKQRLETEARTLETGLATVGAVRQAYEHGQHREALRLVDAALDTVGADVGDIREQLLALRDAIEDVLVRELTSVDRRVPSADRASNGASADAGPAADSSVDHDESSTVVIRRPQDPPPRGGGKWWRFGSR